MRSQGRDREEHGGADDRRRGAHALAPRSGERGGAPRLTVRNLDLPAAGPFGTTLKDISFEVRRGEIFGIAGVAGNGQNELFEALSGERAGGERRHVHIDDRQVGHIGAGGRRRLGSASCPRSATATARCPTCRWSRMPCSAAATAWASPPAASSATAQPRASPTDIIEEFDVRTPGSSAAARSLSGGNLQKFIVGREVLQDPGVLVVSQPTWGVDAGAAAAIHQALFDLAAKGAAVLVISQDLDELLTLTDRIAVIDVGALSGTLATANASLEQIGLLMGGLHGMDEHVPEHEGGIAHVA